jgi:hypothetical protein
VRVGSDKKVVSQCSERAGVRDDDDDGAVQREEQQERLPITPRKARQLGRPRGGKRDRGWQRATT